MKTTLYSLIAACCLLTAAPLAMAQNQYAAQGSYYPQPSASAAQRAEAFRMAQARARGVAQQPAPVQRVAAAPAKPAANRNFVPGRSAPNNASANVRTASLPQQPRGYAQRAPQRTAWNQQVGAAPLPAPGAAAAAGAQFTPMDATSIPGWNGAMANGGATMNGSPIMGASASPMPGAAAPMDAGPVADGGPVDDGGYAGGGAGCSGSNLTSWPLCWEKRLWGSHYHWVWNSTGDMPQHMPYFPHAHGYYYFRPYNVVHGLQQQQMAARWGGDARDPYDIRLFEKIYQEHESQPMDAVPSETTVMVPYGSR